MLVWRKGNIEKNLVLIVLCTIIMVHKGTSSSYRSVNCIGFDLAWFNSVFRAPLCLWSLWCYILIFLLTSFSLPFSELSPVGLALDVVD